MDIGLRIKETVDANKDITAKINAAFTEAISKAKAEGLDAKEIVGGDDLRGTFGVYTIHIPISRVISEVKATMARFHIEEMKSVSDKHITEAVNDLIIEYLSI